MTLPPWLDRVRAFAGHKSASQMLISPAARERFRDFKPTPIVAGAVVGAHARTLAFMVLGIHAGRGTFLLLAIGLDHIKLPVFLQRPCHEVVEPSFWQFPALQRLDPGRLQLLPGLQPKPIVLGVREACPYPLAFAAASQNYRDCLLVPDAPKFAVTDICPYCPPPVI